MLTKINLRMSYPVIYNENLTSSLDYNVITPTLISFIEHTLDEHTPLYTLTRMGDGYTSLVFHGIDDFIILSDRFCYELQKLDTNL